jgi:hypothetical protein
MIESYPETITCRACGHTDDLDGFDVCGACAGNLFCNGCGTEIKADTGLPAIELCGECFGCRGLKESGEFEEVQQARAERL